MILRFKEFFIMKYYSAKTVTKILGVTAQTLRNWDKENKLKPTYVKSNGYRYYSEESILAYTQERKTKKNLNVIGYTRVYKENETELSKQKENIEKYLKEKYEHYEIIEDIGSGINYNKPGLLKLIEKINKKEVDVIVVLYKDRLLRFGFELVEHFASLNNVKIEVLDKIDKTQDEELLETLKEIIDDTKDKIKGENKNVKRTLLEEMSKNVAKTIK
jgi:predicted site-specific integrase-resolvase